MYTDMPGKVFNAVLELARDQHGFVRAADLRELGLDPKRLNDYWRRGLADRVSHGVYRIKLVQPGESDEFMQAAMWPDGRGVLSHETALDLHDLCDVNPNHIDVSVPTGYRTHRQVPAKYRLHRRALSDDDVSSVDGLPVVSPARAIADGIEAGLRPTLIEQAIDTAEREAMITGDVARRLRAMRNVVADGR
jgi:predicted transcriptional regulator of viral defense system